MILNFVIVFLLWPLCVAQTNDISQPVPFQTVKIGDLATIECHIKSIIKKRVWYKYTLGKRLQLVAAFNDKYNWSEISEEFPNRYSAKFHETKIHLSISATTWEDVGTYFCGVVRLKNIQFGSGTFLMLKGANMISESVIQQPESKSVQPGDCVTVSCSHTGHCAAEHTIVTWLKNSQHSAPQIIYFSGNGTCQRKESGKTTCVYSLLLRDLSSDDATTYYCVVTSCGQTLVGNGTRIYIHNNAFESQLNPTIIALMLSNIALGIMTVILISTLCKSRRRDSTASTDGSSEDHQTGDAVTYTDPRSLPRRQAAVRYCEGSVLYSDVRHCQPNREDSS
ncbi:uncharacterized protein LOC117487748 isoform X1 [Trematomus bernacchii]|uniref:uncharacterized protein LOC117487748 isoform X1 n=1 Tax=Trematomus bernacchii TaxID=40690 RepID=UPI00146C747A|nr:uncharacterized protein LOC117487748 isoform X1 [Trematomus bernacchii]